MGFAILITFTLLFSFGLTNAIEFDYCVADPALPHGSLSYACKNPEKLTADDFSYSGLRSPANTSNIFKFGIGYASVSEFPALNGMGIAMARGDLEVGGVGPLHTHRSTEVILVTKGRILAGFIDTNNKPFYKKLKAGDMFVTPPTLAHFLVNIGKTKATAYAAYSSANPGVQAVTLSLFANELPTNIIQKTTLLDPDQIMKLKHAFGRKF